MICLSKQEEEKLRREEINPLPEALCWLILLLILLGGLAYGMFSALFE